MERVAAAREEVRPSRAEPGGEMRELWAELAEQRRMLREGLAEQGRALNEVLAQQRQLFAPRLPTPPAAAARRPPPPRYDTGVLWLPPTKTHPPQLSHSPGGFKLAASTITTPPMVEELGTCPPPLRYEQMVGGKPVARATVAGQPVDCLLDTGSQVSFVTEAFFKATFQRGGHLLRSAHNWLSIRPADGLQIPYVEYFEAAVEIAGTVVENRAILVVRDAHQQFPGLLGMNVLEHVPNVALGLRDVATADVSCFARVAARQAVCVPARTTAYVRAVGGRRGQTALFEPLSTGCGPLLVTSAAVSDRTFLLVVVNPGEADYWMKPGTRLGVLQYADVLPRGDVQVNVRVGEIVVGGTGAQPASTESAETFDLSQFSGTVEERQAVHSLFAKHRDVFAKSEDDLGYTHALQHRIRTTDDTPVTMPYRRIPPAQMEEVKAHLQKLVRSGAIVPSNSAYASAVVLVRKRAISAP